MANSCSKLMKEALDSFLGIDFRYKLDDTLEGLGTQKFTAKQLEGYLLGKGVSPKEIKQSGIFDGMIDDNRALPGDMWLNKSGSQEIRPYIDSNYSEVTLGRKGEDNESYKVTLSGVKSPSTNIPSEPHFSNTLPNIPLKEETIAKELLNEYIDKQKATGRTFIDYKNDQEYKDLYSKMRHIQETIDEPKQSLLGWRRTHIDEINGKKTLVLNEFQSDWAQTERAGRGMFESNQKPKISYEEASSEYYKEKDKFFETNDNEDDWIRYMHTNPRLKDLDNIVNGLESSQTLVADFPMSEVKHHQFQIVGAINDAIKEGIDTVAIPIQRENELVGSAGVTKFYESLNTKILPDIRKKLEKQGLKIRVDKKPYTEDKKSININTEQLDKWEDINNIFYGKNSKDTINAISEIQDTPWFNLFYASDDYPYSVSINEVLNTNDPNSVLSDLLVGIRYFKYSNSTKDLWTLTIEEVPNGKVKWDVYSILAALGLGGYAKQAEASIATEKDIASMKATKPSKVKDSDSLDLAGFLGGAPEVVNPEKYSNNYKGIKDYIAKIESRGASNPYNAKSKTSSASGKYQFTNIMVKDLNQKLGITRKDLRSPIVQEQAMEYLIGEYKEALAKFDIPNKKENIFVLHNLGITGGLRALRGTYEPSDIKNMASNLTSDMDKSNRNAVITNYNTLYNVDIPLRSKINKS